MEVDLELAGYIIRYHSKLLSKKERLAYRHLMGTLKSMRGRTDEAAQLEALKTKSHLRDLLSSDPEVLELARDGYEAFAIQTGRRVYSEHGERLGLNCCLKCGRLARTPRAKQCRHCRHDWH